MNFYVAGSIFKHLILARKRFQIILPEIIINKILRFSIK